MAWGQHLIVDAYDADSRSIASYLVIEEFTKELVAKIDMVAYGEPHIKYFGHGDKRGYTLVQLIETSNICAHFSEDTGNFYLDVFSCKAFSENDVLEVVKKYFEPKRVVTRMINRGE